MVTVEQGPVQIQRLMSQAPALVASVLGFLEEISAMTRRLEPDYRALIRGLAVHGIHKLTDVAESLEGAG